MLLNTAAAWLRELPADVQPPMLCARFPRIANALFAAWPDPDRMHGYFEELLVDRRGGRQGFPKDVLHELLVLRSYYERFHPKPSESLATSALTVHLGSGTRRRSCVRFKGPRPVACHSPL